MPIGSRRTIEVKPGRYSPAICPGMRAHRAGEEAVAIDDRRDLVVEHRVDRLAAIQRFERRERLGLGLDAIGDLEEIAGALGRRRARPGRRTPSRRQRPPPRSAHWLASGRPRIVSPVLGLRICSSVSVPCSNFEPISISVCMTVLPIEFICRSRRSGRRRGSGSRRRGSAAASPARRPWRRRWSPAAGAGAPAPRASRSAASAAGRR